LANPLCTVGVGDVRIFRRRVNGLDSCLALHCVAGFPVLWPAVAPVPACREKVMRIEMLELATAIALLRALVHRVECWRRLGVQLPAYKLDSAQS
jgi:hypothetical protein